MLVAVIAGARPNFVKIAPLMRALEGAGVKTSLVHTGQHYDEGMSGSFFRELDIRTPDYHLEVGSGTHAVQTARLLERFEPVYNEIAPDWLVVVGDVNSTLACALVAAKLGAGAGRRIAHLEAGLRSGDWSMPEEINRVLTDRLSDLLLTPSRDARTNLEKEGVRADRIHFVGNIMIDSLFYAVERLRASGRLNESTAKSCDVLVTLHRPSNVDDPTTLSTILKGLAAVAVDHRVLWPMHPRTRSRLLQMQVHPEALGIRVVEPLGYMEMISQLCDSRCVVTDSGGLQEESTVLGVPCLTLRESTERPVTVSEGTNRLATWPMTALTVEADVRQRLTLPTMRIGERSPEGWDGNAAHRVVRSLQEFPGE